MRVHDVKSEATEREELFAADDLLSKIKTMSQADIKTWVETNVTTVSDVQTVLIKILLMLRTL